MEFQFNVLVLLNVNMLGKIITATFGAMTRKQKKMLFQAIEKRSGHVSALHSASDGGEGIPLLEFFKSTEAKSFIYV